MNESNKSLSISTINEVLQDTYFFYLLLEIKRKLKNIEAKSYLTMFIKGLAVAFDYELSVCLENCNILEKKKFFKSNSMKNKVMEERQWVHQSIYDSKKINKKVLDMGIDFDNEVYDINVVVKNNKILDINFEQYNEDENLDFWDSVFYLNEEVLEAILKVLDEKFGTDIFKISNEMVAKYIDDNLLNTIRNKLNGKRYSYQSHKLFSKSSNLKEIDKIFILYRYRLITSIIMISSLFNNKNYQMIIDPLFKLDFGNYLKKYKALIISIIGNDLLKMNTDFSNNIIKEFENKIDKNFYSINRKLRNNIHYSNITCLTEEELKIIDKNQDLYLKIVLKYLNKNMCLHIESDDISMTNFLKCCIKKGFNKDEIYDNYEKLYLKYLQDGDV